MKNRYYKNVDALIGQALTFYLPLQVQPVVNGGNGEPRDIEASDVENLCVRVQGIGETGIGRKIDTVGSTRYALLYNYVIVHLAPSFEEGDMKIRVSGNYGQVCLDATVCVNIKRSGAGLGRVLPAYVSPVAGDCGTIEDIKPLPLCFTNNGANAVGLGLTIYNDDEDGWHPNLQVSYNGIDWADVEDEEFMNHDEQTYPFALTPHGSIYFRGMNPDGFNESNDDDAQDNKLMLFSWSHEETEVSVSGDIMSLVNYEKRVEIPQNGSYCFTYLFALKEEEFSAITDASNLLLLSNTLSPYCYDDMFYSCHNLVNAPALPAETLADNCYNYMFGSCYNLVNVPALPATTLAAYCYNYMFGSCYNLVNAPALPATTLANYCYSSMFADCTAIVNAPELPATKLADSCYRGMFSGCIALVNAPALPATELAGNCYYSMFNFCSSLVTAPDLPAKSLIEGCYGAMFQGCTSLVTAPALPATSLDVSCYTYMFKGCTSLVNAPALPATELIEQCYSFMFNGCTSLVTAPALPANALENNCYASMFQGCTSLVNAPALPATELASNCYQNMFNGCTSLVKAPVLPAKTLVSYCYSSMFHSCTSLRHIEMHALALSPTNAVTNWVQGVPTGHDGTFVKDYDATWTTTGNSGVPTGWGITYKRV